MTKNPLTTTQEAVRREIKQERAARTRLEILEAAIKLFARRGILATTMAELGKAIKMTPGALYWHFPTKEDLLLAAIEDLNSRYITEFSDLLTEGRSLPAREQLMAFSSRTQAFLRYHRDYGIFFGLVAAESADANDRVAGALRDALALYVQAVAGIVRHGQRKTKEFRADVDPESVAHAVIGAHMGMILHQNLFSQTVQYDPMTSAFDRLLNEGLRPPREG